MLKDFAFASATSLRLSISHSMYQTAVLFIILLAGMSMEIDLGFKLSSGPQNFGHPVRL